PESTVVDALPDSNGAAKPLTVSALLARLAAVESPAARVLPSALFAPWREAAANIEVKGKPRDWLLWGRDAHFLKPFGDEVGCDHDQCGPVSRVRSCLASTDSLDGARVKSASLGES